VVVGDGIGMAFVIRYVRAGWTGLIVMGGGMEMVVVSGEWWRCTYL
jgi:hypothetical protein